MGPADAPSPAELKLKFESLGIAARLKDFVSEAKVRVLDVDTGKDLSEIEVQEREGKCHETHAIVIVFNERRKTEKRPAPNDIEHVIKPFDESRFHFGKVSPDEVLWPSPKLMEESQGEENLSAFRVVVNLFPIRLYHFLLVSRAQLSQAFVTEEAHDYLQEVMRYFVEQDFTRDWHLAFSSFGAFASVNHLHIQILPRERGLSLALEQVKLFPRLTTAWGKVCTSVELSDGYTAPPSFLRCITLEVADDNPTTLRDMVRALYNLLHCLALQDVAHNFVTLRTEESKLRVAIIPRHGKMKPNPRAPVAPAAFELLGLLVVFEEHIFESLNLQDYESLKEDVEFEPDRFEEFVRDQLDSCFL